MIIRENSIASTGLIILSVLFSIFIGCQRPVIAGDLDSLELLLKSDSWQVRQDAAQSIPDIAGLDAAYAVFLLADAINSELENPFSLEFPFHGTYATISERLLWAYSSSLASLGSNIMPFIKSPPAGYSEETQNWLTAVAGFLADTSVHDDIRRIGLRSANPWLRAFAIKSLATYKDIQDTLVFKEAFADTFMVLSTTDNFMEGIGDARTPVFPVRENAIRAVISMGYSVRKNENGFYIFKK